MRGYFTASFVGKKQYAAHYQKIISLLESKNISLIHEHITKGDEQRINMESREERLGFHKKLENWIVSSDFMIAEISFPSISVGYEISLALNLGKPVLALYTNTPPSLLAHHQDEKLLCEKYSLNTLGGIIDDFINYIEGKNDTRFTFFITPEIASYLEKVSRKERLPKSVYLRKLISESMSQNHI